MVQSGIGNKNGLMGYLRGKLVLSGTARFIYLHLESTFHLHVFKLRFPKIDWIFYRSVASHFFKLGPSHG